MWAWGRGVCGADRSKGQQVDGETGWSPRQRLALGLGLTLPGAVPQGAEFPLSEEGLGQPLGVSAPSLTPHPHSTPSLYPCPALPREVPLPGALQRVHQQQPHRRHQDHRQRLRPRGGSSQALMGTPAGGLGPWRSRAKSHQGIQGWQPACGLQAWARQLCLLSGSSFPGPVGPQRPWREPSSRPCPGSAGVGFLQPLWSPPLPFPPPGWSLSCGAQGAP